MHLHMYIHKMFAHVIDDIYNHIYIYGICVYLCMCIRCAEIEMDEFPV